MMPFITQVGLIIFTTFYLTIYFSQIPLISYWIFQDETLFPEGIYFDRKKHQYLTRKINGYLELVNSISRSYADKNIGPFKKIIGKSYPVASIVLHSNQMWKDL